MLNKDEELRLVACLSVARNDVLNSDGPNSEYFKSDLTVHSILWLAEKLLETNDELAKVRLELQKSNEELARVCEELARVWEVYGP